MSDSEATDLQLNQELQPATRWGLTGGMADRGQRADQAESWMS